MTEHASTTQSQSSKMGRPSIYTPELVTKLCSHIADGESLRKVCARGDMPAIETVRHWLGDKNKADFLAQYTRAREEQADWYADEIIEQADKAFDKDSAAAAKIKVDARMWVASKLKPRRYGNQVDITTNGKDLPTPILSGLTQQNISDDINNSDIET